VWLFVLLCGFWVGVVGGALAIRCAGRRALNRSEQACGRATAVAAASRAVAAAERAVAAASRAVAAAERAVAAERGGLEAPLLNALQQGVLPCDCYGVEVAAAHAAPPADAARVVILQCPPVWNKQQMP